MDVHNKGTGKEDRQYSMILKELAIKCVISVLDIVYSCFKRAAVRNQIVFISRESDEKTIDFQVLEKEFREHLPETNLVFLCKKIPDSFPGRIGYGFHILKQMRVIAVSRAVILDTYCVGVCALHQRADLVVIQIWHAMGALKKFGWSIAGQKEGSDPRIAELLGMHRNYTYYTVSSAACIPAVNDAFGYRKDGPNDDSRNHAIIAPLPRMKRYCDADYISDARRRVYERYPEWRNDKIVLYAPTFRKGVDISDDIRKMEALLPEYRLVVSKHPLMEVSRDILAVNQEFSTFELMCVADCIILDFSAVVFEAVFLDKPLIFYPFDYDTYVKNRGFYLDYMAEMPGPVVRNAEKLAEAVRDAVYDEEKIKAFREKWVDMPETGIRIISSVLLERI